MAYNPYLNPYNYQNPFLQQAQATMPQQIQNGGFISVRSEEEARAYPIAPGNSIMFRNETEPYIYSKTMGFNQMELPVFKKYQLVEVQDAHTDTAEAKVDDNLPYATKVQYEELRAAYAALNDKFEAMRKAVNLFTDKEVSYAE